MPVVAIVYGEASGIPRRFVHCDTLEELAAGQHYGKGEGIIIVDPDEVMRRSKAGLRPNLAYAVGLIEAKRGKPSESARCVVIDNETGDIVDVTMADPVIDALPGKSIYQDPEAVPGWKLDGKGEYVAESAAEIAPDAVAVP